MCILCVCVKINKRSLNLLVFGSHPSQGNSTNYYIILGSRDKAALPTSQQIGQLPPKRVKYRHRHPFLLLFLPHPQQTILCSQPIRGKVRRTGQIFPEHVERSFLDPKNSFVPVGRISRTKFAKQTFAQLRTNYVRPTFFRFDEYPQIGSRSKSSPN